jgi:2-dehydropantoate 2-reductase
MTEIKNVCLSGLGAIGSLYGGLLHDASPGVLRVIADRTRIERYRTEGVTINGRPYEFRYVEPGAGGEPAELILIAVKQHHLSQAMADIRGFVGKDTVIVSLLNGIASEGILADAFGEEKILYAFVVGTDAVREGTHTRYRNPGKIVFGEKSNKTVTPRVAAVRSLFERAGITCTVPEDMLREQWWKFMLNVGVNQVSAVLGAPYGAFAAIPEVRELLRDASAEAVLIAKKSGILLSEKDIDEALRVIGTLTPEGKTSMLQDMEAGRKTEVEIFAGTVIELGERYGVETPVNRTLFRAIRARERMNGAG